MLKDDVLKKIGRNICAERNRAGLSQEGLAEILGMNEKHLGKIERGQANPKITTILAIMDALQVEFVDLYRKS